jgi:hypothetical protein
MTYSDFHSSLMGFDVYCKNTNNKLYRWDLFIRNYTIEKIKAKFKLVERIR